MYIGTVKASTTRLSMTKDPIIRPKLFTKEDGIGEVKSYGTKSKEYDNYTFDLSGRKVTSPSPNLIYIKNGKKELR